MDVALTPHLIKMARTAIVHKDAPSTLVSAWRACCMSDDDDKENETSLTTINKKSLHKLENSNSPKDDEPDLATSSNSNDNNKNSDDKKNNDGKMRKTIPYEQVMLLSTFLRKHGHPSAYVHRLLRGSILMEIAPPKKQMSLEQKQFLAKLKQDYAERQYKSMTQNIKSKNPNLVGSGLSNDPGLREARQTISAVISLVVTAVCVFGIVFWVSTGTDAQRVLNGMFTMCIVVVAELYFLLKSTTISPPEKARTRDSL